MSPRSMVHSNGPFLSSPRWAGDFGSRDYVVPGGAKLAAGQFAADDAVVVTVAVGGAAQGAIAIPVTALTGPIPEGTNFYFGGAKVAVTSAPVLAGAVSIPVQPLPAALVAADTDTYAGLGMKHIPSGTILGRTIAERDAGTGFGPAADADDEFYLLWQDVSDADELDDCELYRPGGTVYENFLPNFAAASATVKGKVRALYQCSVELEN